MKAIRIRKNEGARNTSAQAGGSLLGAAPFFAWVRMAAGEHNRWAARRVQSAPNGARAAGCVASDKQPASSAPPPAGNRPSEHDKPGELSTVSQLTNRHP